MKRLVHRNALLAKPPHHHHYLTRNQTLLGKAITSKDYEGVHSTGSMVIAAGYAYGTVSKCRCGYPVIIELDVSGLNPLPDIDAMLVAESAVLDRYALDRAKTIVGEHDHIEDAIGDYGMDDCESESVQEGSHWTDIATADFNCANVARAFQATYQDDNRAWDAFIKYAQGGDIALEVLANLTEQRRWMHDFEKEHVQAVYAYQPIWDDIIENYWETDDADLEAKAKRIEAAGYQVVTLDDAWGGSFSINEKLLYKKPGPKKGSGEYHGTSSAYFQKAFPEIKIPKESPFKVEDLDDA